MDARSRWLVLRLVLGIACIGHLVVGLSFWFVPQLAIDEILAWGEPSGWTSVLGAYDIAVAVGLAMALRDPDAHAGFIRFVAVLLSLHGGTHAYFNIWGDSPPRLWLPTGILFAGSVLLAWLGPRAGERLRVAALPTTSGVT